VYQQRHEENMKTEHVRAGVAQRANALQQKRVRLIQEKEEMLREHQ
jgi:hypothetical protein